MRSGRPFRMPWSMDGIAGLLVAVCLMFHASVAVARTLEEIQAIGMLRICIAGSSAAFYRSNGEAFARYLKVQPEIVELGSFDEQFQNVQGITVEAARYDPKIFAEGRCDVLPNDLHIVPWRQTKMLLVPYYRIRKIIVSRQELRPVLKSMADLAGRTAAVQQGTSYETWLNKVNRDEFSSQPLKILNAPTQESVQLVADGLADFTVLGTDGAFKWVRSDASRLAILFPVDEQVGVGWAVPLEAHSLAERLERFFIEQARVGSELDGNWQQYYRISLMEYRVFQTSFESAGVDVKTLLAWGGPLAAAVLTLVAAMLFWSLRNSTRHQCAVEALRASLEATVEAIVATVESRDPYTAGHQRRVADLASAIAREMGLPADRVAGIGFGALIHDLGKIRVPDELLCKPTRLTRAEFEVIKMHPEVGYGIVKGIDFPWPIAGMIHQHHERLDGSGYPQGLRGEEILLEARILAVADTVEAMASHRPYRPGLGVGAALEEIERNCGGQYDVEVVRACLRLFRQKRYLLPEAVSEDWTVELH